MLLVGLLVGSVCTLLVAIPIARMLLRRATHQTRLAERRARSAERLAELGSLTGGLAHEIKNPLSTIGLNAQLLVESINESDLPDDQRQRLIRRVDSLAREAERLRGILNDFLQFAGRIKLDPQMCDIVEAVSDVCDFFHPQCDQAHVVMRTQLPNGAIVVPLDASLFKQSLLNLLINAVQAMQPNGESVSPGQSAGELIVRIDDDDAEVRVYVIDTGPGIADDQIERIFHPYVSTKSGGTGLGLPTARRIIEEHGGRLTVESDIGQGSEFVLHLPCRQHVGESAA